MQKKSRCSLGIKGAAFGRAAAPLGTMQEGGASQESARIRAVCAALAEAGPAQLPRPAWPRGATHVKAQATVPLAVSSTRRGNLHSGLRVLRQGLRVGIRARA
jgi:hypothetical protein